MVCLCQNDAEKTAVDGFLFFILAVFLQEKPLLFIYPFGKDGWERYPALLLCLFEEDWVRRAL